MDLNETISGHILFTEDQCVVGNKSSMDLEKSDLIQKYSFIVIKVNEPQTGANAISINYGTTIFFYIHKLYFFCFDNDPSRKEKMRTCIVLHYNNR